MLLVDKYNPRCIKEIIGNSEIISILENIGNDFPHLLFTGPPGTGKTTVSHIIRNNFNYLELNASDERGIETIRVTLKNFCNKNIDNK
jgi:replication factor C subunit 2/4